MGILNYKVVLEIKIGSKSLCKPLVRNLNPILFIKVLDEKLIVVLVYFVYII